MAQDFIVGRGVRVILGRQGNDDSAPFVPETITAEAAAAAAATSITVAALGANVLIHAGSYLNFKNPTTGVRKLVRLTDDANATDTTLTVEALSAEDAIEDGDVAVWPPILGQRTNSSIMGQGNRVTSFPYEQSGYEDGFNATISNTCTLTGNYAIKDAGYSYALWAFQEFQPVRLRIEFPQERPGFTQRRIVEGRFSFTNVPRELPSDQIISSNIEGSFNGKILDAYGLPLSYV